MERQNRTAFEREGSDRVGVHISGCDPLQEKKDESKRRWGMGKGEKKVGNVS